MEGRGGGRGWREGIEGEDEGRGWRERMEGGDGGRGWRERMEGEPSPTSLLSLTMVFPNNTFSSAAKESQQEEILLLLLGNKSTQIPNLGESIFSRFCAWGRDSGSTGVDMAELSSRAASGSFS